MRDPNASLPRARLLTALSLLWLVGIALRLTILAVPPVIPLIHDDLDLNATQIGILTGLPSMLFAIAAVPGSLLIARLGVTTAMVVGLGLNAIGGALRGALPDIYWLYAMTIVMGAGVAIMQVTLPPAVRELGAAPHRIFHRRLYQRPADRRTAAGGADAAASCCRSSATGSGASRSGARRSPLSP